MIVEGCFNKALSMSRIGGRGGGELSQDEDMSDHAKLESDA